LTLTVTKSGPALQVMTALSINDAAVLF